MFQLKVISASVWRTNTSVLQRGKKKKEKKSRATKHLDELKEIFIQF